MKIEEMPRASEGDTVELEGTVFRLKEPNSNEFEDGIVWGQFVVIKDDTGEQGCWLKLSGKEDRVSKGTSISIKGKLGKEYTTSRGKKARSINNCDFEVVGKMQAPAQSSTQPSTQSSSSGTGNGTKDNYWEKKFEWEVKKDKRVQYLIVRQCAVKAVTELAVSDINYVKNKKEYFGFADEIIDYIYKKPTDEEKKEEVKEEKKERIKKAREVVGKTEFKPASTKQKNIIYGYKDKDGYHKGIIDSRYIETHEIKEIGDPKKLSVEKASEWIEFWWGEEGNPDDIGARKQREKDNPRDENGKPVGALVKGDKTSVSKDVLVDEIYALRRENRLNDDEKFKEVMGYDPKIENLTEKDCLKVKDLLTRYIPF